MNSRPETPVSQSFAPGHAVCVRDAADDQGNHFTIASIVLRVAGGMYLTLFTFAVMAYAVVTGGSQSTRVVPLTKVST